jgi:hypothetical protein
MWGDDHHRVESGFAKHGGGLGEMMWRWLVVPELHPLDEPFDDLKGHITERGDLDVGVVAESFGVCAAHSTGSEDGDAEFGHGVFWVA